MRSRTERKLSKSNTIGIAPETRFVSTAAANHANENMKIIINETMSRITYLPIHAEISRKLIQKRNYF